MTVAHIVLIEGKLLQGTISRHLMVIIPGLLIGSQVLDGHAASLHPVGNAGDALLLVAEDQVVNTRHKGSQFTVGQQREDHRYPDGKDEITLLIPRLFFRVDDTQGHHPGIGLALIETLHGRQLHGLFLGNAIGGLITGETTVRGGQKAEHRGNGNGTFGHKLMTPFNRYQQEIPMTKREASRKLELVAWVNLEMA